MKTLIAIPARLHSTRLSEKLTQKIDNNTVIWHTVQRARAADVGRVVLATDSNKISIQAPSETFTIHDVDGEYNNGTERICGALSRIKYIFPWNINPFEIGLEPDDIVINVQGDEPLINPAHIQALNRYMQRHPEAEIATIVASKTDGKEGVKIYVDNGLCKDFYRKGKLQYHHVGCYAYRYETLQAITQLPQTKREKEESLEQLRWLDNGYKIHAVVVPFAHRSIDTAQDLIYAREVISYIYYI